MDRSIEKQPESMIESLIDKARRLANENNQPVYIVDKVTTANGQSKRLYWLQADKPTKKGGGNYIGDVGIITIEPQILA